MIRADLLGGLLLLSIGAGAIFIALGYPIGTAARMGAGYMPIVLGGALVGLGLILVVGAFWNTVPSEPPEPEDEARQAIPIRPLVVLPLAVVVFGLLLERVGLAVASVAAVMIAGAAYRPYRPLETAVLAVVLTAAAILLFAVALGMPFRIWPL